MNSLVDLETKTASSRRVVEFIDGEQQASGINLRQNSWDWPRIKALCDEVFPLSDESSTITLNADVQSLAARIYPFLPKAKRELKSIIKLSKAFAVMIRTGSRDAKSILAPYRIALRVLKTAARQKLAVIMCQPNLRNWHLRAYRLFLELQQNLGRLPRLHFVTLTIRGNPCYNLFRERVRKLKRRLNDQGFEVLSVIASHPKPGRPGRPHAHLVVWSLHRQSAACERTRALRFQAYFKSHKSPFGFTDWATISKRPEILRELAYVTWNYNVTISLSKGEQNPIPARSRVISRPRIVTAGVAWLRVGRITLVTPASTAWRGAVARYASAHGHRPDDDLRWIWRERRRIRRYLVPETWTEAIVTGLDGYTYQVTPAGEDVLGNETYRLSNEERGSFYLTDYGLEGLAKLQAAPGVFAKNERLDLTTGVTANCYEVLGLYAFVRDRTSAKPRRNRNSRPR